MAADFGAWLAAARQAARQPPARPRLPLWVAGRRVGSVAEGVLNEISLQRLLDKRYQLSIEEQSSQPAWHLDVTAGAATDALNTLAEALRDAGRCGPWRNEQLAVDAVDAEDTGPGADGSHGAARVGTVERGAVRVLGIATRAVHLVGLAPDGRMWVQKRARDKPNNPGMWDTLMGGMVAAGDTLAQALARETWEEAGLRTTALAGVAHGGQVAFSRPSREGGVGVGYMVERIDWFRATVPEGMAPANQDGEVECFDLLAPEAVRAQVAGGHFTPEAGLVIAGFLGC